MAHIKTGSKWVRLEFPNPIKQAVCIFWNTCCEGCACTYADSLFCTALRVHITERTWEPLSGPLQAETTSTESIKLQLHVPSMIQTTGNKKSLLQRPKLKLAGKSTLGTWESLVWVMKGMIFPCRSGGSSQAVLALPCPCRHVSLEGMQVIPTSSWAVPSQQ